MINVYISSFARQWLFVSIAILITIIFNSFIRSLIRIPKHLETKRSKTYVSVIRNLISLVLYSILLHIIFLILGINIAPLLASAGIIGLAVGIGARPFIEDIISGIFLLSQKAIAIGDYIRIDDLDEGYIDSIGIRTLTLRDINGAYHLIPNGMIKRVINYSQRDTAVLIDVPVKASQPVDDVYRVLDDALKTMQQDKIFKEFVMPESKVLGIDSFATGEQMNIKVSIITPYHKRFKVSQQYRYLVKKGFEKQKFRFA